MVEQEIDTNFTNMFLELRVGNVKYNWYPGDTRRTTPFSRWEHRILLAILAEFRDWVTDHAPVNPK